MENDQRILIPVPALFSFEECVWFLNRNYDDCLHIIKGGIIFKAIEIGPELILMSVKQKASFLEVTILNGSASEGNKQFLVRYVVEWFDMDRDIQPFYDRLGTDGRLAYMTEAYKGLRVIGIANLFEAICWCIIGQQINLSFAYKLKRRLVEQFGQAIEYNNEVYYVFPSPEILSTVPIELLKEMQFSGKKSGYLVGIAKAFVNGTLSEQILMDLPDFESRKKALVSHKGVGAWTANYALMKSLRQPEGVPHGDIGLLNALAAHGVIAERSETDKIESLFTRFAGWESYLVFYLWRSLAVKELL